MTRQDSLPLTAAQQAVFDLIDDRKHDIAAKLKSSGLRAAVGYGAFALAALLLPATGVPGFIATAAALYGSYQGWDTLRHFSGFRSLGKAKAEAVADPTLQKTADRAAATKKRFGVLSKICFVTAGLAAAAVIAVGLAPLSAAIFTVPALFATLVVALPVAAACDLAKGSYKAAEAVAEDGQRRMTFLTQRAALEAERAKLSAGLAKRVSPGFEKAVNGDAPEVGRAEVKPVVVTGGPKP